MVDPLQHDLRLAAAMMEGDVKRHKKIVPKRGSMLLLGDL